MIFINDVSQYYPSIDERDVKVMLIEASTELLTGFPQKLAAFAKEKTGRKRNRCNS